MYDTLYNAIKESGLRILDKPTEAFPAFTCNIPFNYVDANEWIKEHKEDIKFFESIGSTGVNVHHHENILLLIWVD